MRIYLGAHLNFYHPQKKNWLEVELASPAPLIQVLQAQNIPPGEVYLVVVNGQHADLQDALVTPEDEVRLYPAVGGG